MWNYIYFVYYLFNKVTTEYTGTEAEIRRKMENRDYNWVPYMATEAIKPKEEFELDKCLRVIKRKIDELPSINSRE